jgi:hypothetical protein
MDVLNEEVASITGADSGSRRTLAAASVSLWLCYICVKFIVAWTDRKPGGIMEELIEYRKQLIDKLSAAARDFRSACLAVKNPFAPIAGGWNAHQVAVHTRDVENLVYGMRVRRTLEEDHPLFPTFDGDAYMAEHYDKSEPLPKMLEGFDSGVQAVVGVLRKMPDSSWGRESRHATQGDGLTLQHWVERGLAHIEEHLATLKTAE